MSARRRARRAVSLAAAGMLALAAAATARAAPVVGAQGRLWSFTNGLELRDAIVYAEPGPLHLQFEVWDRSDGIVQYRPEAGVHVRDARRSSYALTWRHEAADERVTIGTEQVAGRGFVVRGDVAPLLARGGTSWTWNVGADRYWGSYDFAGATLVRDPRSGGLWAAIARVRFATERDDWVQFTVAPASRRTIGGAVDVKWRVLRAGIERNSRFDFTDLDNVIGTLGVEFPLGRGR